MERPDPFPSILTSLFTSPHHTATARAPGAHAVARSLTPVTASRADQAKTAGSAGKNCTIYHYSTLHCCIPTNTRRHEAAYGTKSSPSLICTLPKSPISDHCHPPLSLSLIHEDQEAATARAAAGLRSDHVHHRAADAAAERGEGPGVARGSRRRRRGSRGEAAARGRGSRAQTRGRQAPGIAAGASRLLALSALCSCSGSCASCIAPRGGGGQI